MLSQKKKKTPYQARILLRRCYFAAIVSKCGLMSIFNCDMWDTHHHRGRYLSRPWPLTLFFPPPLNPHPLLQQVPTPDLTFQVLSTTERVAVLFITLRHATRSPRIVCDGDVNGDNSLFHQALGMSVNEKICALELTAQNSLFSDWHAKILRV